jgi:hypothetical protein
MAANYLEQLVAEWLEFCGYFVRRNVMVGKRTKGGYECELDVVAFHPSAKDLVHIEPSMDALPWDKRELRYRRKFDAGRKHIQNLFRGLDIPKEPRQLALVGFGSNRNRSEIGGGRIVVVPDLLAEILTPLQKIRLAKQAVPEQFPLLRTLQYVAEFRHEMNDLIESGSSRARVAAVNDFTIKPNCDAQ